MSNITITLTEDQYRAVINSVENNFMDFSDLYPEWKKPGDKMAEKHNAYYQRLLTKLAKAKS